MKKILQKDSKVLRQKAKEIKLSELGSLKIKKIIEEMSEALASQHDGVAIAAPQIGYSLRIFLVYGKIFNQDFNPRETNQSQTAEPIKDLVFINPKIIKLSKGKEWVPEGCLSVRPIYGKTFRSKKATIVALDENGKKFERGASGLLAQIFQHETDHLEGILFIDHAKDLEAEQINV
jgi:peptide deformylase